MVKYKVLELFSGIGGMHAAVDLLQVLKILGCVVLCN